MNCISPRCKEIKDLIESELAELDLREEDLTSVMCAFFKLLDELIEKHPDLKPVKLDS